MKRVNLILILFFCSCFADIEKTIKMPRRPTIITINNTVHQNTHVRNKVEKLFEPMKKHVSALRFSLPNINKRLLVSGGLLAGSAAIWSAVTSMLILDARFIADIRNWAYWNGSTPLSILKEQEQVRVAKQLFEAIVQTYGLINGDFLTPLADFMSAVKQEELRYKRFIAWHHFLSRWRLSLLFPGQKDSVALAQNNLERLAFYRKSLLQWILENKYEGGFV